MRKENAQLKAERQTLLDRLAQLSNAPSTPVTATDTATGPNEGWRDPQRADDYTFLLKGCQRKGETVSCQFSVTANDRDNHLYLWGKSRLIEKEGTQRLASSLGLAGRTYPVGQYSSIAEDLVRGVPMSGEVTFEGVTTTQNVAAVIEIVASAPRVQFRDVPLS